MKRLAIGLMMLGSVALGGCQSDEDKGLYKTPQPLDKLSKEDWCAFYARYIADPTVPAKTKQVDVERMRARGCQMAG